MYDTRHHAQPGSGSPERRGVQSFKSLERGMFEGSEQGGTEFQVQGEETEGEEGGVGEEDGELAGLEVAEYLSGDYIYR
jgi:hypothetical protein